LAFSRFEEIKRIKSISIDPNFTIFCLGLENEKNSTAVNEIKSK
jgi:hypothetical protein